MHSARDENPLRVHAVEDVAEALPLLTDEVFGRDLQVFDEELAGVVVHHRIDGPHRDPVPDGRAQIDEENREAPGLLLDLVRGRRSHEQEHQVRVLRARDPDLLTVHDVAIPATLGEGLEPGGVGARGRLGDAEGLEPQLARGDRGQEALLLLLAPVAQQGAHHVHLGVTDAGARRRAVDRLEDQARFEHPETAPAVLLGDERREPSALGEGVDELRRVAVLPVDPLPVVAGEAFHDLGDGLSDLLLFRRETEIHRGAKYSMTIQFGPARRHRKESP